MSRRSVVSQQEQSAVRIANSGGWTIHGTVILNTRLPRPTFKVRGKPTVATPTFT